MKKKKKEKKKKKKSVPWIPTQKKSVPTQEKSFPLRRNLSHSEKSFFPLRKNRGVQLFTLCVYFFPIFFQLQGSFVKILTFLIY